MYNNTWWNWIANYFFDKNRRNSSLKFSVSYEKDTAKDSEAKQLIKPWPYRTIPNWSGRNLVRNWAVPGSRSIPNPQSQLSRKVAWAEQLRLVTSFPKTEYMAIRPIPGKVKLLLISGKKSPSLLDHISRFLSHQFFTWYLRSISKTKIVKLFCPCMSEHMIYIKNVTNVTQTLHQNVANVTKQNIASKEILTIEFHTKYMKLFVNMLSIICVLLNTKFHNTSENIYFEVIWSRTIVSCKVTNVTNRYMDFNLDLDEELNFQRPVCLDSNRKHYYQSKTCW